MRVHAVMYAHVLWPDIASLATCVCVSVFACVYDCVCVQATIKSIHLMAGHELSSGQ